MLEEKPDPVVRWKGSGIEKEMGLTLQERQPRSSRESYFAWSSDIYSKKLKRLLPKKIFQQPCRETCSGSTDHHLGRELLKSTTSDEGPSEASYPPRRKANEDSFI
jgi:hypothetical protein